MPLRRFHAAGDRATEVTFRHHPLKVQTEVYGGKARLKKFGDYKKDPRPFSVSFSLFLSPLLQAPSGFSSPPFSFSLRLSLISFSPSVYLIGLLRSFTFEFCVVIFPKKGS